MAIFRLQSCFYYYSFVTIIFYKYDYKEQDNDNRSYGITQDRVHRSRKNLHGVVKIPSGKILEKMNDVQRGNDKQHPSVNPLDISVAQHGKTKSENQHTKKRDTGQNDFTPLHSQLSPILYGFSSSTFT